MELVGVRFQAAVVAALCACSNVATKPAKPPPPVPEPACAKLSSAQSLQDEGFLHAALAALDGDEPQCDSREVLRERARVLGDLGLAADAIAVWRAYATSAAPNEAREAASAIAELEARPALDVEVADDDAKKAIALYRDGVNLRLSGDHETAISQLRRSYAIAPHALTIVQIALAHRAAGDEVEARKAAARALAIAEATQGVGAEPELPVIGRDWISQVALDPSGRVAVVAHIDGMMRTFDVATRSPIAAWEAGSAPAIAVDPAGRVIAVGDNRGSIATYELATGDAVGQLPALSARVKAVGYSPDGSILAALTADAVALFDAASGQLRRIIEPAPPAGTHVAFMALAFSPDGAAIATSELSGPVRAWDVATGDLLWRADGGEMARSVAFSPDGTTVIASGNPVRTWSTSDGSAVAGYESLVADQLAFTSTGQLLADGDLRDPRTGQLVATLHDDPLGVHALSVAGDGTALVTSARGPATIVDTVGPRVLGTLGAVAEPVRQVAVSSDGSVWAVARREGYTSLWSRGTGRRAWNERHHSGWVDGIAVSDDGELIASGDSDGKVVIVNRDGLVIQSLELGARPTSVALSPDGALMATGAADNTVALWRTDSAELVHRFAGHTDAVQAVALDRAATTVYSASFDGAVKAWDVASGEQLRTYDEIGDWVLSLAVTADGSRVIGGGANGSIVVWNARTGAVVHELAAARNVEVLALLAGKRILSSNPPEGLDVWSLETGERIHAGSSPGRVSSLAPLDRNRVLIGSPDGRLRIWDLEARAVMAEILEVADGAWVVVAADGRVDGSDDGHRFLTWKVGDIRLPGFVGWQRQRAPGLLTEL